MRRDVLAILLVDSVVQREAAVLVSRKKLLALHGSWRLQREDSLVSMILFGDTPFSTATLRKRVSVYLKHCGEELLVATLCDVVQRQLAELVILQ